ncbi:MAG: YitT family protein [Clostridia bacterium]|nr:YitT family protein [Clostridia bacterium]
MRAKIKNFLTVLLGTIVVAIALDAFLAPADIAPGGISGLAIVINHLADIPLGFLILVLNIPIFIWGLRHFSHKFLLYSLLGMFLLSLFTDLLAGIPRITEDVLLSAIYGGLLLGIGVGLVFSSGCTTGGTDIAAQILKKKFPAISVGRFVLIIDAFIITLAGIIFGKWEVILYSAIAIYISTFIIDIIVEGGDAAKAVYIISDLQETISDCISKQLGRGTTLLHGSSFYTNSKKGILLCVVRKHQISSLKNIIKEVDENAFVIFTDARQVLGNGFDNH